MSSYCRIRGAYGTEWEERFVCYLNSQGIKSEVIPKVDYGTKYKKYSKYQLDAKVFHSNGNDCSILELKRKTQAYTSLADFKFPTLNLDPVETYKAKVEKPLLYIIGNSEMRLESVIGVPVKPHLWGTKRGEQSGDLLYECRTEYCLDFSESMNQIANYCGYDWQPF